MWIYPVDMKRANEFGQVFEKEKDDKKEEFKSDEGEESTTETSQVKKRGIKASENQN